MKTEAILLVDAGNSRIKWGLGESGQVRGGPPFPSGGEGLTQGIELNWTQLPVPGQVLVSNVAGDETGAVLHAWLRRQWNLAPRFVRATTAACGIRNGYEEPGALGVDRWVALIGARGACREPLCIADCGTALTLDAMDAEGRHLGGLIAPGLGLMRQSLVYGAPALSRLPTGKPSVPSRNTADGVQGGILQMAAGAIERFVKAMELRVGTVPHLFLTGGDSPAVSEALNTPYSLEPDLILRGLLLIAEGDS